MLFLVPFLSLVTSVLATGYFTNPAGNDGSLSVKTGDTIDVSWTNITDYDIISVGYYSGSNQTITWLISNSNSHPTSYRWTVDAVAQGFDLADSSLFAFYACKDYNFGDPFISSYFIISDDTAASSSSSTSTSSSTSSTSTGQSSTSTSTNTATATSNLPSAITPANTPSGTGTAATASATGTSAPTNSVVTSSSSSLSTGAKAGIAVGVVIGVLGFAAAAFMFFRQRRQQAKSGAALNGPKSGMLEAPSEPPVGGSAYDKSRVANASGQPGSLGQYAPMHEAPDSSLGGGRPELGSGGDGAARAELQDTSRR